MEMIVLIIHFVAEEPFGMGFWFPGLPLLGGLQNKKALHFVITQWSPKLPTVTTANSISSINQGVCVGSGDMGNLRQVT